MTDDQYIDEIGDLVRRINLGARQAGLKVIFSTESDSLDVSVARPTLPFYLQEGFSAADVLRDDPQTDASIAARLED